MIRYILFSIILLGCKQASTQADSVVDVYVEEIIQQSGMTVSERFAPPLGYQRVKTDTASYCFYLQNFKVKEHGAEVFYYDGNLKPNQRVHAAILDIDVGNRDLQQCADAVMRLRAEYLYQQQMFGDIKFNFVSDGKPRYFLKHSNNKVDYTSFRSYMNYVFAYANTRSLHAQLKKVVNYSDMQIGDVFIQTGNPFGHAVIVMDMAINNNGEKLFLLAQSYMPAQSIHILNNPLNADLSPWYELNENSTELITPEWVFTIDDLRRF